jgi:dihydroxyacetone kinase phosphoprotein-dependent L subunit
MLAALNEDNIRGMIIYVADKIIENKPLLTEVDSKIGDGDHGIGMAGGMQKAKEAVSGMENSGNAYALFERAGKAMLMSMGGASGVIFGSLYMAGVKGAEAKSELSPYDITLMMEKSLAAIKERGKAQVGDKTMVDALEPAVKALKKNQDNGLAVMLKAAAEAAAEGVENTKKYQAKFGRAKSLMERAIGFQDAGATSVWLIFRSMHEFVEQLA